MVLEQPHWHCGAPAGTTELEIRPGPLAQCQAVIASLPDSDSESESDSELQWAVGDGSSAPQ